MLLLEVRLDRHVLSDGLTAYQYGSDILLPLGELAGMLTIGITAQPEEGIASGFVLREERTFSLNLAQGTVTREGRTEPFDRSLVQARSDDIYVAIRLITQWLPLDFDIDMSTLVLTVRAREPLPLQLRFKREQLAAEAGTQGRYQDPGFPRLDSPYQRLGTPFLDQTLAYDRHHGNGITEDDLRYTAFLTTDLLGMETALYFSDSTQDSSPEVRLTIGRHDPGAGLLGPLHARAIEFGDVPVPGVSNISFTDTTGNGVILSNRPLTLPTMFGQHTLQGDLPPGWDVELYYNDALIGFQQSGPEGLYTFADQPLLYGPNEFRLVFHGPLGQTRVERQIYYLEQSIPRPGEFLYSIAEHRDLDGQTHLVAEIDAGLGNHLAATGGVVEQPVTGTQERYAVLGLNAYWQALILTGDLIRQQDEGSLAEGGLKTRIGGFSLDVRHAQLNDFTSELFPPSGDPVRTHNTIRIGGTLPLGFLLLPVTLEGTRDRLESGEEEIVTKGRLSAYLYRTSITNELRRQWLSGAQLTDGTLQISRRLAAIGLNGQLNYTLKPENELTTAALTATQSLADGYLINLGMVHTFTTPQTLYSAGVSKNLGRFGMAINSSYATHGEVAVGMQLFIATGMEPRRSEWWFDAQPMANTGAVSARVFLDRNVNGIMDPGEEPIEGIGFTVNGARQTSRTDAAGISYLSRMPIYEYADIAIDTTTLEDPQWLAQPKGVRLVPRPGKVNEVEFPVVMTSEIDGTVYLIEEEGQRGIGSALLELVDASGQVVGRATSSSDGFYIVPAVLPGHYKLRISPEQLSRLNLSDPGARPVTVSPDGEFVNGVDFTLTPKHGHPRLHAPHAGTVPEGAPAPSLEQKETGPVPAPATPDQRTAIKAPVKKKTSPGSNQSLSNNRKAEKLFNQGLSLYYGGDNLGARRAFEKSIRLNPKSARTYYYLGYTHYNMKEFSKARKAFSRCYELDPDFSPRPPDFDGHSGKSP